MAASGSGSDPGGFDERIDASDSALPEESARRLRNPAFSSGLSVPDFAACLHAGMRPVGLVQGFCVISWSWFGVGGGPWAGAYSNYGTYGTYGASRYGGYRTPPSTNNLSSYSCPHSWGSDDHRYYGNNFEWTAKSRAWSNAYNLARKRMLEECEEAGGHGVIGVVDRTSQLIDSSILEFHMLGTAVVVDGAEAPSTPWSTYLAGQRLSKLVEAGYMPRSVAAVNISVVVNPVCMTQTLLRGRTDMYGMVVAGDEVTQLADAHMEARRQARDRMRHEIGVDDLHGADMRVSEHEIPGEMMEVICTLRGTRVHQFADAEPLSPPVPTVHLG